MHRLTMFLDRHSLACGIVLMFLLTWPIALANAGLLPVSIPFLVYIMMGWGFIVAALLMTGLTRGRGAVTALLKRFLIWRVGWQWYLVALFLFPTIFATAVWLNAVLTQTPIDFSTVMAYKIFGAAASLPLLVMPYFLFDAFTNGEEMGWRGYVLPRLQAKYNPLVASVMLGIIWGIWHLPRFFAPDNSTPFGVFLVKTVADAVIYTWVYNRTRGSLLLTTILHAAGNTASVFLPIANTVSATNLSVLLMAIALEIGVVVVVSVGDRFAYPVSTEPVQVQS